MSVDFFTDYVQLNTIAFYNSLTNKTTKFKILLSDLKPVISGRAISLDYIRKIDAKALPYNDNFLYLAKSLDYVMISPPSSDILLAYQNFIKEIQDVSLRDKILSLIKVNIDTRTDTSKILEDVIKEQVVSNLKTIQEGERQGKSQITGIKDVLDKPSGIASQLPIANTNINPELPLSTPGYSLAEAERDAEAIVKSEIIQQGLSEASQRRLEGLSPEAQRRFDNLTPAARRVFENHTEYLERQARHIPFSMHRDPNYGTLDSRRQKIKESLPKPQDLNAHEQEKLIRDSKTKRLSIQEIINIKKYSPEASEDYIKRINEDPAGLNSHELTAFGFKNEDYSVDSFADYGYIDSEGDMVSDIDSESGYPRVHEDSEGYYFFLKNERVYVSKHKDDEDVYSVSDKGNLMPKRVSDRLKRMNEIFKDSHLSEDQKHKIMNTMINQDLYFDDAISDAMLSKSDETFNTERQTTKGNSTQGSNPPEFPELQAPGSNPVDKEKDQETINQTSRFQAKQNPPPYHQIQWGILNLGAFPYDNPYRHLINIYTKDEINGIMDTIIQKYSNQILVLRRISDGDTLELQTLALLQSSVKQSFKIIQSDSVLVPLRSLLSTRDKIAGKFQAPVFPERQTTKAELESKLGNSYFYDAPRPNYESVNFLNSLRGKDPNLVYEIKL